MRRREWSSISRFSDGAANEIDSIDYASFDTASGEYKPNSPASGLNSGSSTGLWSFLFSNESLNPNGQVDEVKLKYQEGKAVIRGAQGVEIVNVRFEGMDEVELEAASLGGRVLMSGTLVSDPTIAEFYLRQRILLGLQAFPFGHRILNP